jgi:glyoxylase-like metal-dependent hydrolase (beta-lactamase superfamily II)
LAARPPATARLDWRTALVLLTLHHSLIVAFKDHLVVVEAPLNEERSLAVMAKLAEIVPGKPVKYVVPTHYHFDHSGGLRTYIAKGVTILTTPGNAAFIERLATAPHTIRPDLLSREPRKARDRDVHG